MPVKKILIARNLHVLLMQRNSFLNRSDVALFTADSNDEALEAHRTQRMSLIITQLDMPGMNTEQLCALIRGDEKLRMVSLLMVCAGTPAALERSAQCGANVVLPRPVNAALLLAKAQQLVDIASRATYRVLLSATFEGRAKGGTFTCLSNNISGTGLRIETATPLAMGAQITFSLVLSDSLRINAAGKVVRIVGPAPDTNTREYGVAFTEISPDNKEMLLAFINKQSGKTPSVAPS